MGDFWISVAFVLLYAAALADIFVTRWGVWYKGLKEANPLAKWFTRNAYTTFLDGVLKLVLLCVLAKSLEHLGYARDKYFWMPLGLAAVPLFNAFRNFLLLRKLPPLGQQDAHAL